jgi:predicted nucleic acid-binding Zn ribbon protein
MGRAAPRPLGQALDRLTASLAPATTLARVQALWAEVAGATIAAAATPSAEYQGVLTLRCNSSVWAQELDLLAVDLLPRLNQALGDDLLHKLRCRVG